MDVKRITYNLSLSAGTVLLAGVAALAQTPGSPQQPGMPSQQQPSTTTSPNPGMGPGAYPGTAPTGQDLAEKTFVSKALQGGETGSATWAIGATKVPEQRREAVWAEDG